MRFLLRSARATSAAAFSFFAEQSSPTVLVRAISRQSAQQPIALENNISSTVKATQWEGRFTNIHVNMRGLSAASAAAGSTQVRVPSMGESITDGEIANILKQSGDYVQANDVILQIETDKVTIDVIAPVSGTIQNMMVSEGDTVSVDQEVAVITESGEPTKTKPAEKPAEAATPTSEPLVKSSSKPSEISQPVEPQLSEKPAPKSPESSPLERRVPMTRPRRRIATRLKDAQNTYALLTTFNEVDMTGLSSLRKEFSEQFFEKHGAKLGFMSFFVKAAVYALQKDPIVNAVIDGDDIIHRDYYDISIAVGTPKGLVVPVIRSAERKGFSDIEKELGELAKKARNSELSLAEMTGGTFTISNGGVYGSLLSTPILNPPQSAILGMHSIQKRPVVINDEIVIRPMMYLALTYDHRLIDGREAVTFLRNIKAAIEDPRRLLLDL